MLRSLLYEGLNSRLSIQVAVLAKKNEELIRIEQAMFITDRISGQTAEVLPRIYIEIDDDDSPIVKSIDATVASVSSEKRNDYRNFTAKKKLVPELDDYYFTKDLFDCATYKKIDELRVDKNKKDLYFDFVFLSGNLHPNIIQSHINESHVFILVNDPSDLEAMIPKESTKISISYSMNDVENRDNRKSNEIDFIGEYVARHFYKYTKLPSSYGHVISINDKRFDKKLKEIKIHSGFDEFCQQIGNSVKGRESELMLKTYKKLFYVLTDNADIIYLEHIENVITKMKYIFDNLSSKEMKNIEKFDVDNEVKIMMIQNSRIMVESWIDNLRTNVYWLILNEKINISPDHGMTMKKKIKELIKQNIHSVNEREINIILEQSDIYRHQTNTFIFDVDIYIFVLKYYTIAFTKDHDKLSQLYFESSYIYDNIRIAVDTIASIIIQCQNKVQKAVVLHDNKEFMKKKINRRMVFEQDQDQEQHSDNEEYLDNYYEPVDAKEVIMYDNMVIDLAKLAVEMIRDIIMIAWKNHKFNFLLFMNKKVIADCSYENIYTLNLKSLIDNIMNKLDIEHSLTMINRLINNEQIILNENIDKQLIKVCTVLIHLCGNSNWLMRYIRSKDEHQYGEDEIDEFNHQYEEEEDDEDEECDFDPKEFDDYDD